MGFSVRRCEAYRDYEDPYRLQQLIDEAKYRLIGADLYEAEDIHEEIAELTDRLNFAWQDEEADKKEERGMGVTIIYNKYTPRGAFVAEREYTAKTDADYVRVMDIIERNPDEYEVINEYFN